MADNRRHYTQEEVLAVIERRTIPEPNSGCLLWEGHISGPSESRSYGKIRFNGKMVGVHRFLFERAHGPIPADMQVLHRCDLTLCCNPDHLFLGTNDENHADKAAKDRGRKRLTHRAAKQIHIRRMLGESINTIAETFDVNISTIARILGGQRRPLARSAFEKEFR